MQCSVGPAALFKAHGAAGIDFHTLDGFSLVIVKPDRRILYTGCQWSQIAETGQLSEMVAEKITVVASKRVEIPAA